AGEGAVSARRAGPGCRLGLGERRSERDWVAAEAERGADGRLIVTLQGVKRPARGLEHGAMLGVFAQGESWIIEEVDPLMPPPGAEAVAGRLTAPMPGRVVQLLV